MSDNLQALVRHGFLTKTGVLSKLSEGWELGSRSGLNSMYWMQKSLCCGGDSERVRGQTVHSLVARGQIVRLPKRTDDPYWLTRYSLPNAKAEGSRNE
jgi:hypothetical protein